MNKIFSFTTYSLVLLLGCFLATQARPRTDLNSEIYRSDDIGRLRRGFQTSALATARGFGKRGAPGNIPFISGPVALGALKHQKTDEFNEELRDNEKFPVSYVVEMIRTNPSMASALVDRFADLDNDGFISTEEILRLQ